MSLVLMTCNNGEQLDSCMSVLSYGVSYQSDQQTQWDARINGEAIFK